MLMGLGQGDWIASSLLRLLIGHRVHEIEELWVVGDPLRNLNARDFGTDIEVEESDTMRPYASKMCDALSNTGVRSPGLSVVQTGAIAQPLNLGARQLREVGRDSDRNSAQLPGIDPRAAR